MTGVILFAHGSLLCGAGQSLLVHAQRLRESGGAPIVEIGYLNYSEPRFIEAVARCAERGATRIIVTPYFLIPGKFVSVDLPRAVAEAERQFPALSFSVASAIGFDERLADALISAAEGAKSEEAWGDALGEAVAFCRALPECPLYETTACPRGAKQREEVAQNV